MQTAIIKDLCVEIKTGGTPSRKNLSFFQGDIPWIKTGELKGWYIDKTKEKITPEAILKSSAKLLPKDTKLSANNIIIDCPAASPSSPSIQLMAFTMPANQKIEKIRLEKLFNSKIKLLLKG